MMKAELIESRFLFEASPGSVHASTVALLEGEPVAACFCGSHESADDVDILVRRGSSAPVRVSAGGVPHWNPVLFAETDGTLTLFFKVGRSPREWFTMAARSADGLHWSEPACVDAEGALPAGPVKNKPVSLPDGTLAAPASVETAAGKWSAYVSYRTGCRWRNSALITVPEADGVETSPRNPAGIIQPTLWLDAGGLHFLARSTYGCLYRADAADFYSFGEPYALPFPNNNSGVDLARASGLLWLCANPVGSNWGARSPLTLSCSADGENFTRALTLEDGEGEYSYPAIISQGDDILHITYTHNRTNIVLAKVKII